MLYVTAIYNQIRECGVRTDRIDRDQVAYGDIRTLHVAQEYVASVDLTDRGVARIDERGSHGSHRDGAGLEIRHRQIREIGAQRVYLKQLVGNIQHAHVVVAAFADEHFVVGRINEQVVFESIRKYIVVTIGKNKCTVRTVRIRHSLHYFYIYMLFP